MERGTTYVGMDVHKRLIALAMRDPSGAVGEQMIPHEPRAILRWVRKVKREATGPIRCAYEAGPTGYYAPADSVYATRELRERSLATKHGHAALPLGNPRISE